MSNTFLGTLQNGGRRNSGEKNGLWEGQIALRFYQKYLNLCSEDERRFYGFDAQWRFSGSQHTGPANQSETIVYI